MANDVSVTELLGVLARRRNLVLAFALAALGAAALASTVQPRQFKCRTRIEVRGVQGVDTQDVVNKARGVKETLRNRMTFDQLVKNIGLDRSLADVPPSQAEGKRAALVDSLIAATQVTVDEPTGGLFYIQIENAWTDPDVSFKVCEGLAGLYRNDVINKPIEDAQRVVDQAKDDYVAAEKVFQAADQAVLEHMEKNRDVLDGMDQKRTAVVTQVRQLTEVERPRLAERKAKAEEICKAEPRFIDDTVETPQEGRIVAIEERIRGVRQKLREMQEGKGWTDEYPDVKVAQSELAALEAEKKQIEETTAKRVSKKENPTWVTYDKERRDAENELARVELQIAVHNKTLGEIKEIEERRPPILKVHEALDKTKANARLALDEKEKLLSEATTKRDTYAKDRALNFTVVDAPQKPRAPGGPGPAMFALAGLGAGAAIGLVVAYVRNAQDKSFREVDAVASCLGVPTLGAVHVIETADEARAARAARGRKLAALGLLACVSLGCVGFAMIADSQRIRDAVGDGN